MLPTVGEVLLQQLEIKVMMEEGYLSIVLFSLVNKETALAP